MSESTENYPLRQAVSLCIISQIQRGQFDIPAEYQNRATEFSKLVHSAISRMNPADIETIQNLRGSNV